MAIRLCNCSSRPLRVDLRGGSTLLLPPGATSQALLEEQLYDNMFIAQWEREGLIARLPARFSEVGTVAAGRKSAPAKDAVKSGPEKGGKKAKGRSDN